MELMPHVAVENTGHQQRVDFVDGEAVLAVEVLLVVVA